MGRDSHRRSMARDAAAAAPQPDIDAKYDRN
jgi:hypothetical protein